MKNKFVTKADAKQIRHDLLGGKHFSKVGYSEFVINLKRLLLKIPIIEIVNDYGIYAYESDDNTILFGALDIKTGVPTIFGRESLRQIRRDIKKGIIIKIEKEYPGIYSVEFFYKTFIRELHHFEKYDNYTKRFLPCEEHFVLDLGAGNNPDIRSTHAIDLIKSSNQFKELDYKTGYNLQSLFVKLPYSDAHFDRVISYGGLGINFESLRLYKEIYRILKNGGNLEFNQASYNTKRWLNKAGFRNIRKDKYFDEIVNKKIGVIIASKGFDC